MISWASHEKGPGLLEDEPVVFKGLNQRVCIGFPLFFGKGIALGYLDPQRTGTVFALGSFAFAESLVAQHA